MDKYTELFLNNTAYKLNTLERNSQIAEYEKSRRFIKDFSIDEELNRYKDNGFYTNYLNGNPSSIILEPPTIKSRDYGDLTPNYKNYALLNSITKEKKEVSGYYFNPVEIKQQKIKALNNPPIKKILL